VPNAAGEPRIDDESITRTAELMRVMVPNETAPSVVSNVLVTLPTILGIVS